MQVPVGALGSGDSRKHFSMQNPLKSNSGSFLRSPFELNLSILPSASMLSSTGKGQTPSIAAANRTAVSRHRKDGESSVEARAWQRAGVGASRLSVQEAQRQRKETAEIYGVGQIPVDSETSFDNTSISAVTNGLLRSTEEKIMTSKVVAPQARKEMNRLRNRSDDGNEKAKDEELAVTDCGDRGADQSTEPPSKERRVDAISPPVVEAKAPTRAPLEKTAPVALSSKKRFDDDRRRALFQSNNKRK